MQRGSSDDDAWREVVAQVPSWPGLAAELAAAAASHAAARRQRLRALFTIEGWKREFAIGFRVLRKDRGFTATAIVTLVVCLGGHAAIVTAVNAMLFHPLRVPEPERVLLMANQYPLAEARRGTLSATPARSAHGLLDHPVWPLLVSGTIVRLWLSPAELMCHGRPQGEAQNG